MTAREKLAMEHPDKINGNVFGSCIGCPYHFGYLPIPDYCGNGSSMTINKRCTNCWDREIPNIIEQKIAAIPEEDPDKINRKIKEKNMSECCKETMCTTCVHQDICSVKEKFLDAQKAVDGLVVYDKLPDGKLGQVKLRDIGFIKPVELVCIHYIYKGSAGVKEDFMPNQPKPQDILNSIGAMAEMMDAFYKQLINRGFDKGDALYLTGEFLKTIIKPKQGE